MQNANDHHSTALVPRHPAACLQPTDHTALLPNNSHVYGYKDPATAAVLCWLDLGSDTNAGIFGHQSVLAQSTAESSLSNEHERPLSDHTAPDFSI